MVIVVGLVLLVFVIMAVLRLSTDGVSTGAVGGPDNALSVLAASALIFVAFAGYARITVLGEEVRNPARVIPLAVAISFAIVASIYVVIAFVVWVAAADGYSIGPAALADIAAAIGGDALVSAIVLAAVLAAGAVLLNLIAGVGRTLFAMAARGDAPAYFSAVSEERRVPHRAEIAAAAGAALLVAVGGLTLALAVSAAMILTYYAVAHISAMRIERAAGFGGLLLAATPVVGLVGCALLVGSVVVSVIVSG
jgi:APA family basic amino acid/polyamine antiporter